MEDTSTKDISFIDNNVDNNIEEGNQVSNLSTQSDDIHLLIPMDSSSVISPSELLGSTVPKSQRFTKGNNNEFVQSSENENKIIDQKSDTSNIYEANQPRPSFASETSQHSRYSSGGSSISGDNARKPWYAARVTNMAAFFNRRRQISRELSESFDDDENDYDYSINSEEEWSRRILPRDRGFHQSSGVISIEQKSNAATFSELFGLYSDDWFHRTLIQRFWLLFLITVVSYTLVTLILAVIFYGMNDSDPVAACCLFTESGTNDSRHLFFTAFAFALETSVTSGYSLPSFANGNSTMAFWVDCPRMPLLVWIQTSVKIVFSTLVFSLIISRCGRADIRARRIVFSDKACITNIHGQFYFAYQVFDLQTRKPTVEASTRAYAVFNASDGQVRANFQTRAMRIQNPDDEIGADLFMATPCTVIHHIDQWSPLLPPTMRREHWQDHNDNFVHNPANRYQYPHMSLREADSDIGSRDSVSCPVCGTSLATDEHLLRHIRYAQYVEELDESSSDEDTTQANDEEKTITDDSTTLSSSTPPASRRSSVDGSNRRQPRRRRSTDPTRSSRRSIDEGTNRLRTRQRSNTHTHKFVKTGGKTTVDSILKSLGDLSKATGHKMLPVDFLATKFRLVSKDPTEQSESLDGSSIFRKSMRIENARDRLKNFVEASELEVIVLVEGIEPHSSDTFQARHSYTANEILFDHWFEPCMFADDNDLPTIDLDKFHKTFPVDTDTALFHSSIL